MKKISFVIFEVVAIVVIMGVALPARAEQLTCDFPVRPCYRRDLMSPPCPEPDLCGGVGGTFAVVKLHKPFQCKSNSTGLLYNVSIGGLAAGAEVHGTCDLTINVFGGKPEGTYIGQTLDISGIFHFGGSFPMVALHWSNLIPHHFIHFIGWGGPAVGGSAGVLVFVTIERVGGNDSPEKVGRDDSSTIPAWLGE